MECFQNVFKEKERENDLLMIKRKELEFSLSFVLMQLVEVEGFLKVSKENIKRLECDLDFLRSKVSDMENKMVDLEQREKDVQ